MKSSSQKQKDPLKTTNASRHKTCWRLFQSRFKGFGCLPAVSIIISLMKPFLSQRKSGGISN